MRTWIKGGLWGAIIGVLLILLGLVGHYANIAILQFIFAMFFLTLLFLFDTQALWAVMFFFVVISFIIGAFIGWIIGKIKSRA